MTPTLTLRQYQVEAIETWKRKGGYGCIVLPTGTGKTWIGLEAIRQEVYEKKGKVAIIVPTIALAYQWRQKIQQHLHLSPTLFYGDEKHISPVTIFVVNSAYLYKEHLGNFSLVIIDEAHHLSAPKWSQLLSVFDGKRVLGLTATPEKTPLPVVYYMSIPKARQQQAVVNVRIKPVFVSLTPDEWYAYQDIDTEIKKIAMALESAKRRGDRVAQASLETRLQILINKRKQLTSLARNKFEILKDIAHQHPGEKILIFTESIESAERARKTLVKFGVSAQSYHSRLPQNTRKALLDLWGKSFKVLIAVRCLDEGIDVPEVATGIIIASGKSTRQLVQRLGRILRPHPGKQLATMYVVIARGTYEHEVLNKLVRIAYSY
jgi:superfamily II DNA or RNA helicase